MFWYH